MRPFGWYPELVSPHPHRDPATPSEYFLGQFFAHSGTGFVYKHIVDYGIGTGKVDELKDAGRFDRIGSALLGVELPPLADEDRFARFQIPYPFETQAHPGQHFQKRSCTPYPDPFPACHRQSDVLRRDRESRSSPTPGIIATAAYPPRQRRCTPATALKMSSGAIRSLFCICSLMSEDVEQDLGI